MLKRVPGMATMTDAVQPAKNHKGRIKDARGRKVTPLDPVRLHLLNQRSIIPAETLRSMADQILPGARRQRLILVLIAASTVLFIAGGTILYFSYFSTWTGFDPVSVTIHVVQVGVILSGPLLAFRMARAKYANRIALAMLEYRCCPHCGYDIRGLPVDPADGATVCPECGCAWTLSASARSGEHAA